MEQRLNCTVDSLFPNPTSVLERSTFDDERSWSQCYNYICSMEFTRTVSWSIWLWRRSWGDWIYIACWWLGLYRIVYTFYFVLDHIFVRNGIWVDFLFGYWEFQTWLYRVNIIDIQRPRFAAREAIHETTDSRSNKSAKLWWKWIWQMNMKCIIIPIRTVSGGFLWFSIVW